MITALSRFKAQFIDDWRGQILPLVIGSTVIMVFSQAWLCPIFGYNTEQTDNSIWIRNFYYPFYLLVFILAATCWWRILNATWRAGLLLLLLLLATVSYAWSIDSGMTLRRLMALFVTALFSYAVAARFGWKRLTEVIGIAFVVMMIGSYFYGLFLPQSGRMQELFVGAWRGLWIEKNNLGSNMTVGAIAAIAAALHNPNRRIFWFSMAALMFGLVILSTSKTSLMSLVLGLGLMGVITLSRKGPVWGVVTLWFSLSVAILVVAVLMYDPKIALKLLGKDATLTGRIFIWEGIAHVMKERPLLGYGYGVVWSVEGAWTPLEKITNIAGFRAYHAHSCWYEVWLNLGLVGLVLWGALFLETCIKAVMRVYQGLGGFFVIPYLFVYFVSSLTESIILGWNEMRWALFMVVVVKLALPDDRDATKPKGFKVFVPFSRPQKKSRTQDPEILQF